MGDVSNLAAPAWFQTALAQRPEHLALAHDGLTVRYRAWGGRGRRVVVLVHGGSAHAGWWDHIAPLLAAGFRVVAPDLTGHGRSDRRAHYGLAGWAQEVLALAAAESVGTTALPLLVGHSMGGWVALTAAGADSAAVAEVVVVDSPLRESSPEEVDALTHRQRGALRTYPSAAEAISRFRLVPGQENALAYVVAHVAAESIEQTGAGWTWRFDPQIWHRVTEARPELTAVRCPVTLLSSERGLLTAEMAGRSAGLITGPVVLAEIPNAGHHAMFDEPLVLVTALRMVLARW